MFTHAHDHMPCIYARAASAAGISGLDRIDVLCGNIVACELLPHFLAFSLLQVVYEQ